MLPAPGVCSSCRSRSSSSSSSPPPAAAEGAKKVSLVLYYESLCPYCSRFIVNHLAGIFEDGLIDAVDLRLVPYGNARVGSNGDISCQVKTEAQPNPTILQCVCVCVCFSPFSET